jgi:hypothetical protein
VTIAAATVAVVSGGDWAGVAFVAVVSGSMCVVIECLLRRVGAVTRAPDDDPTVRPPDHRADRGD